MWVSTVNLLPSVGGMLVDTIKDQMVMVLMVGKLVLETIRISLIVAIVFFFHSCSVIWCHCDEVHPKHSR